LGVGSTFLGSGDAAFFPVDFLADCFSSLLGRDSFFSDVEPFLTAEAFSDTVF